MSYNGSGTYSLPAGQPVVTGTTISSSTHNTLADDIATAFNTAWCRDGQAAATANIPMGGFRIQNLGPATGLSHAVQYGQMQNAQWCAITTLSGANTIVGSAPTALVSLTQGQIFTFTPTQNNTGPATLNPSSLGASPILYAGTSLSGGELRSNVGPYIVVRGANSAYNIIGPIIPARQSDQESGTANTMAVTPLVQQYHPSAAKGWVKALSNSTTIEASYNVTSIVDSGTGFMDVNWATDFSSIDYCAVMSPVIDQGGAAATTYAGTVGATALTTGATRWYMARVSDGTLTDPSRWMCVVLGDQA